MMIFIPIIYRFLCSEIFIIFYQYQKYYWFPWISISFFKFRIKIYTIFWEHFPTIPGNSQIFRKFVRNLCIFSTFVSVSINFYASFWIFHPNFLFGENVLIIAVKLTEKSNYENLSWVKFSIEFRAKEKINTLNVGQILFDFHL